VGGPYLADCFGMYIYYIYVHTRVHNISIYLDLYIHIYIHTYIHTYIQISVPAGTVPEGILVSKRPRRVPLLLRGHAKRNSWTIGGGGGGGQGDE